MWTVAWARAEATRNTRALCLGVRHKGGTSKSGSSIHIAVAVFEASKRGDSHCEKLLSTCSLDAPEAGQDAYGEINRKIIFCFEVVETSG